MKRQEEILESLTSGEDLEKLRFEARALRYRLENLAENVRMPPETAAKQA